MVRTGKKTLLGYLVILLIFFLATATISLAQVPTIKTTQPRQILVNPDFSLPLDANQNPPGWFRAMIPNNTIDLKAGVSKDNEGPFLFLEQKGVKAMLFNNWAQRIENPPIGAKVQLEALVSTENAGDKGAVIMVMFFKENGDVLGAASSEGKVDLTGTKPWTKITLDANVPTGCNVAIVRLGLSQSAGKLKARYAKLFILEEGKQQIITTAPSKPESWTAGLELLANGNFEETVSADSPTGWFRAMMPNLAIDHKAGTEELPNHGKVAFIEQKGTKASVINNWAQRLEVIPVGARLKLTADVKTQNVPENTGVIMIQCWDTKSSAEGKLLAAATSQSSQPIGGTQDWKTISMEITVPDKTDAIIVRCGLSQSGKIWFDNVSLKIISPPPSKLSSQYSTTGFEVTDESLKQLDKIKQLSEKLVQLSERELDENVQVRKEIYALGNGQYQVVLSFILNQP